MPALAHERVSADWITAPIGGPEQYERVVNGRRAKVLLGQLAAWATGHQEAFEIEARFKAEAEAKVTAEAEAAKAASRRTGFA